jgi:hypothetical protein
MTNVERMLAAIHWYSLYMLRFEVAEWAVQATERSGAGPATFGAAALLVGFLGRFDDAERFANAGIARAAKPNAPDTVSCWTGLMMSRIGHRESGLLGEAANAAHQTGGLGEFGDALMSAIIAGQEVITDPASAAQWAQHAETLVAGRRNPALCADVLSNLAVYYALAGTRREASTTARKHSPWRGPITLSSAY